LNKPKRATWKDNFKLPEEPPTKQPKRAGICSNCGNGGFTLGLGKNALKGQLLRSCMLCKQIENPDTGEVIRRGTNADERRTL
jgi:hypothetical protein